jgi:hypothetical protein
MDEIKSKHTVMNREEKGRGKEIVPPSLGTTTPPPTYPSGDYTYVLEIVMNMQNTMGKLTEACESLKTASKSHGEKLEQIGKDVHAAKVVGGFVALIAAVIGWIAHEAILYLSHH